MNCNKYIEWLSAALDGELTAEQHRELDAHLAHCPDCAALFEQLSANSRAMRKLDCEFPEGLHNRIMNNLPAQDAPVKKGKVIHWKRWASLAACLVLVVAIGTFARFALPSGGSMAPAMQSAESAAGNSAPREVSPVADDSLTNAEDDKDFTWISESTTSFPPAMSVTPEIETPGSSVPENAVAYSGVQYLRVSYGYTPAPSAVVISSASSLEQYLKGFGSNRFDADGNSVPDEALEELKETYTDEYFTDRCLAAVIVESGSGSTRYEVLSVVGGTVTIRTIVPEAGTCDMAAWLIVIELDEMLDDGSTLDVNFIF